MALWSASLLEDDLALEVRDLFDEALEDGMSVEEATEEILEHFEEALEDEDDGPIILIALAVMQAQHDEINPEFRDRVLELIQREESFERWDETDPGVMAQRRRALDELVERLSAA